MSHYVYSLQNNRDGRVRAEVRIKFDGTMKVHAVGEWRAEEREAYKDASKLIGKLSRERAK